ncbi:Phosphatidylinositol synthase [Cladobotryum mycophilum]|uniref:CDP-diacylglycerol--inositol 3-phosphatidyltransferase n=1 Tax=Cladobotryum mycophilum TaxID=491253 RepID=A0ABR0T0E5_9HYPO
MPSQQQEEEVLVRSPGKAQASETENDLVNQPLAKNSENIFLFWPNIIDGYTARIFNQGTQFGAVLDMVTDRCTTSCLLVFLSTAMPRWAIVFQGLIALDFASHYMQMYTTLVIGGAGSSHKDVNKSQNWLMNLYYSNKIVLFTLCALNELFFISLYLLSFSSQVIPLYLTADVDGNGRSHLQPDAEVDTSLLTQIFPDPFSAAALEMARANKMDQYWPNMIAQISFPFMALKQIINVIQLVQASRWLAREDARLRRQRLKRH